MNLHQGEDEGLDAHTQNTHIMGPPQGRTASLRHPDITELSFLDKFPERPYRFLDWNTGINSSTLEQVQFLCPSEILVDIVNAAPQTFFETIGSPFNRQESLLHVFRVLLVECSKQVQVS